MRKKVICAMSGGIDSSVTAALLKRANFDVTGVFMKLADSPNFKKSEKRARKIAKFLKIPFFVFDFRKEFRKRIINCFLRDYRKGLTPNPCVFCNKQIKFGLLLEKALKLKADFLATGHYAKRQKIENRNQKIEYKLLRAKDKDKDQSYFLWRLNQNQLKHILFPIENYTRKEVEGLAKKFKLPILNIKKSVEICFIKTTINLVRGQRGSVETQRKQTSNGVNDFLMKYLKEKPGKIVDIKGKVIGEHKGLWFYTIGQRKGIGLAGGPAFAKASAGKPFYVLDKDLRKNILIVTKNKKDLEKKELIAQNINWISGRVPKLPLKIKAKIRYRHHPASAVITKTKNPKIVQLKFYKAQAAITPGQSVVFYRDQELLGGGIIN